MNVAIEGVGVTGRGLALFVAADQRALGPTTMSSRRRKGLRPAAFALLFLVCGSCGPDHDGRVENTRNALCSESWKRNFTDSEVATSVPTPRGSPNTVCDEEGNTPLHLALSVEGVLSENGYYAIAGLIRSGADLFAVNRAGESAVTFAERRFQRMLARWDRDLEKLCQGVDVMDEAVQRERWENSLYYLVRTDAGLETLEEVRGRTNARRERMPSCAR